MVLAGQVEQPAGGADRDVDTGAQRGDLRRLRRELPEGAAAAVLAATAPVLAAASVAGSEPGPLTRWSTGMPKARVLPVPVLAWPITSAPVSATGMVADWIGNGAVMPRASSASTVSGSTPSSAKLWAGATVSASVAGAAAPSSNASVAEVSELVGLVEFWVRMLMVLTFSSS